MFLKGDCVCSNKIHGRQGLVVWWSGGLVFSNLFSIRQEKYITSKTSSAGSAYSCDRKNELTAWSTVVLIAAQTRNPSPYMESEVSLLCSQKPDTWS
jgi:hypothetical protein